MSSVRSAEDSMSQLKVEMVVLEINFGKGRKDDILVHFGDNPRDLAEQFVAKHLLKKSAVPAICATLEQTIADFRSENDHSKYFEAPMNTSTPSTDMIHFAEEKGANNLSESMPEAYKGQPPVELQINGLPLPPSSDVLEDNINMINGHTVEFPAVDFPSPSRYGSLISFDSNTTDNISSSQPVDETRGSFVDTDTDTGSRHTSNTEMGEETRKLSASTLGTSSIYEAFNILDDERQHDLLFDSDDLKSSPSSSSSFRAPLTSAAPSCRPISSSRTFGGSISGKIAASKLQQKSLDKMVLLPTGSCSQISEIMENENENENANYKTISPINTFKHKKKMRESFLYEDIYKDSGIIIVSNNRESLGLKNSLSVKSLIDEIPLSSPLESTRSSIFSSEKSSPKDCDNKIMNSAPTPNYKIIVPKLNLLPHTQHTTSLGPNGSPTYYVVSNPNSLPFNNSGTNSTYNSEHPSPGSVSPKPTTTNRLLTLSPSKINTQPVDFINSVNKNEKIEKSLHINSNVNIDNSIPINKNQNNIDSNNDNDNIIVMNSTIEEDKDLDTLLDSNSTTPISAAQQQRLAAIVLANKQIQQQQKEIVRAEEENENNYCKDEKHDREEIELKENNKTDIDNNSQKEKNYENEWRNIQGKIDLEQEKIKERNEEEKNILEPCSPDDDSLFRFMPSEQSFKSNSILCDLKSNIDPIEAYIFSFSKNTSVDGESPSIEPGSAITVSTTGISSSSSRVGSVRSGSISPVMRGGGKRSVIESLMEKEMDSKEAMEGNIKIMGTIPNHTIPSYISSSSIDQYYQQEGDSKADYKGGNASIGLQVEAEIVLEEGDNSISHGSAMSAEMQWRRDRDVEMELEREKEREKERERLQGGSGISRNRSHSIENDPNEEERMFLALKSLGGKNQGLVPSASVLALNKKFRPESQQIGGYAYSNKLIPKGRKSVGDRLHDSAMKSKSKREKSIIAAEEIRNQLRLSSQFAVKGVSKQIIVNNSNTDICSRLYNDGLKLIEKRRKRARDRGSEWTCSRCGVNQLHNSADIYTIDEDDNSNNGVDEECVF